jgi:hypothetical protein
LQSLHLNRADRDAMDFLVWPDEYDAHVDACYDADAPLDAVCAWCRGQIEKLEELTQRQRRERRSGLRVINGARKGYA